MFSVIFSCQTGKADDLSIKLGEARDAAEYLQCTDRPHNRESYI
jgi:hypothetical protein